ncbi:MAG TPA: WD40 repeat domain-containing protein, partial [Blastocatellia bacterium]|nr:WD40 repeat domain-containing protein [Blastocatellia bacterium]
MNNPFSSQKASGFVLLMVALQLCAGLALAQKQRKPAPSDRGLKVSKQPPADQPQRQGEDKSSPASADDKPHLVVQLGGDTRSVAYSKDGRFILTGALLWDAATGQEIRRFVGHPNGVDAVAFSPDGKSILTGGTLDKTACIWNIATGKEIKRLISPNEVRTVAYSSDGKFILTGGNTIARLWDAATGREIRSFIGHSAFVVSVKFSPDGRYILTGSIDKTARLWDVSTGREIRRLVQGDSKNSSITSVAFSPDGRFILTGGQFDQTARLWDAATGKALKDFKDANWLYSVAFSPDGRSVLTAGDNNRREDNSPRLWDVATGQEIRRFGGYSIGGVKSAAFSSDGRFVLTGCGDSTARLWDVATGNEVRRFEGYSSGVYSVAFSRDGQSILTGSEDQSMRLWDVATGGETRQFVGHTSSIYSVAPSPDGRYILTSSGTDFGGKFDNTVRLWETATGAEIVRYSPGDSRLISVRSIAYSPDGNTVAIGISDYLNENPLVLLDIAKRKEIRRFLGDSVASIAYSPDSRFILAAGTSMDGTARLWDIATGEEVKRFKGPKSQVAYSTFVAYSPDGKYVLTTNDQDTRLWDVATGNEIRRFITSYASLIKFSPDGQSILTAGRYGMSLWDVATGREIRRMVKGSWILSAAFSPDGRFILAEEGSSAVVWDAATGQRLCQMISFKDGRWVVVTPDGRFDTNDLEEIKGLHWIMPDDPMRALPLEVFMREYYEPRLLPRILSGEKFKPIKALLDLNRVQPNVSITGIHYQEDSRDTVIVTVEVSKAKAEFQRGGKTVALESGAYDLRLFRDGQLVGYAPKSDGEITIDPATNKEVITFRNIKLPRKKDATQVEFSAYAFNVDRVKSATDRKAIQLVKELPPITGRAYLITFGVNAYE